jgi:energy-coupling factor transporter transmembrane protein EcfT
MDKDTKNEIFRVIDDLYSFYGKDIPIELIAQSLNFPISVAEKLMDEYLGKVQASSLEQPKEKRVYTKRKIIQEDKPDNWVTLWVVLIEFFSLVCGLISCYYTYQFFSRDNPVLLSLIFSVIIVGFAVVSLQVTFLLLQRKNFFFLLSAGIFFFTIVISITTTIGGQYNNWARDKKERIEKVSLLDSNVSELQTLIKQEKELEDDLVSKKNEVSGYSEQLKKIDYKTERRNFDNINWLKTLAERSYEKIKTDLGIVRDKKKEIESTGNVKKYQAESIDDFYEFGAKAIGVNREIIQFWIMVMLGLVPDVLAPTGVLLGMVLNRKREV